MSNTDSKYYKAVFHESGEPEWNPLIFNMHQTEKHLHAADAQGHECTEKFSVCEKKPHSVLLRIERHHSDTREVQTLH